MHVKQTPNNLWNLLFFTSVTFPMPNVTPSSRMMNRPSSGMLFTGAANTSRSSASSTDTHCPPFTTLHLTPPHLTHFGFFCSTLPSASISATKSAGSPTESSGLV